ncbi:MAG: hypothetical protein FGM18_07455 [Burkholderiaceae bacterium]|nr:hypothetical protein [Burkholderiaceae bacterium]
MRSVATRGRNFDTGPGWQTRMNNALRDWLKRHSPGKL